MQRFFTTLITSLFFSTLVGALSSSTVFAEVYKQVNPDGSITFTDKPGGKNKTPVPLSPMSTFEASPAAPASSPQESTSISKGYTSVNITSPANDETIRDNTGSFTVTAAVAPGLQSGDKMVLLDNGSPQGESTSGNFTLSNIDRGAHALTVQVQNSAGKTLISSKAVTIYLRRHSALR